MIPGFTKLARAVLVNVGGVGEVLMGQSYLQIVTWNMRGMLRLLLQGSIQGLNKRMKSLHLFVFPRLTLYFPTVKPVIPKTA